METKNATQQTGGEFAALAGSANLASSEDGWSKMKAALKLQATIELQCCEMSNEEVSAKLASLAEWQEAVRKSHPADRRSLLADILALEALEAAGSGGLCDEIIEDDREEEDYDDED